MKKTLLKFSTILAITFTASACNSLNKGKDLLKKYNDYDTNKDSYLTKDELSKGGKEKSSIFEKFDKIDENKDLKLSKDEVKKYIKNPLNW